MQLGGCSDTLDHMVGPTRRNESSGKTGSCGGGGGKSDADTGDCKDPWSERYDGKVMILTQAYDEILDFLAKTKRGIIR